ncbi:MAG: SPFH domain-containing protein [Candidatus Dormibacteria bacterium]
MGFAFIILLVLVAIVGLAMSVRIAQEYERGVVFRLGRLQALRGPGFFLIIPFGVDRLVKIDLRTVTLEVPPKEVITRDNVTIKVIAVIYFKIVDPQKAVTQVLNYVNATSQIAQTTLRSVLGESTLDELLAGREEVNRRLQLIIDEHTGPWGVKVSTVEVKDVELPQTMQRAMAKEAESEREKRAKIIHARGEFEASQQLMEAAAVIGREPAALQLRYLQTLTEIGVEKNTTIIFPLPVDIIEPLLDIRSESRGRALSRATARAEARQEAAYETAASEEEAADEAARPAEGKVPSPAPRPTAPAAAPRRRRAAPKPPA